MNLEVIISEFDDKDGPEVSYLCEVSRRLQPLFPTGLTRLEDGIAFMAALRVLTVEFDDGFTINSVNDITLAFGNFEAVLIVAAFDSLHRTREWWDEQRLWTSSSQAIDLAYDDLLSKLRRIKHVTRVF